jgi:hypothetical protein
LIKDRVIADVRNVAASIGQAGEGAEWYLFGSVYENVQNAADIDLLILCVDDIQADTLRLILDSTVFSLPLHLALLTYDEAAEIDAVTVQRGHIIFP